MANRSLLVGLSTNNGDIDAYVDALHTPSLFDYDVVIFNLDSFFNDDIKSIVKPWDIKHVSEETYMLYRGLATKLKRESALSLQNGGTIICLISEKRTLEHKYYDTSEKRQRHVYVSILTNVISRSP